MRRAWIARRHRMGNTWKRRQSLGFQPRFAEPLLSQVDARHWTWMEGHAIYTLHLYQMPEAKRRHRKPCLETADTEQLMNIQTSDTGRRQGKQKQEI